ncbi:hypothetical protein [Nocardia sp. NPDC059228]|uniref:hypothetical protein n=1 Tax=Nocardia sp. NPDC059228 TaxID=3346777 RepID=UPI0036C159B3
MSENTANRNRARRRVVRQAGPPVEGESTGIEVQVPTTGAVSQEPTSAAVVEPSSAATVVDSESGAVDGDANAVPAPEDSDAAAAQVADESAVEDNSAETPVVITVVDLDKDEVADTDSESDGEDKAKSRVRRMTGALGRMGTIAAVVALISTLVLIGSGGVFFYHQHRADALNQRRAEYIQVAKQAYINMATVNDATAGQDIDRLLSVAGGSLKDEYAQNKDTYKKIFEQLKVQSSGKVIAAAIESDDADSASVLLLAQQTVSNTATNGPMQRDYRVRVYLTRTGDTVSASSVEFVP